MKKVKIGFAILSILFAIQAFSQVAINTSGDLPASSSMLDVSSITHGVLLPRMSADNRDDIVDPASGLIVYVNDDNKYYYYNGTVWVLFSPAIDAIWDANGNTGIQTEESANENYLRFDTDGTERMVVDNAGNIGVGIASPDEKIHIYEGGLTEGSANALFKIEGNFTQEFLDADDIVGIQFEINSQADGINYLAYALNGEGDAIIAKDGGNLGVGTTSPDYKLEVSGNAAANNIVSTIPLWQGGEFTMTNTSGQDLSNCESALIPIIYATNGSVDVKLVIRIKSTTAGSNSFQLRTHNGTTESYPIVSTDSWTWTTVQSGFVVESEWKSFAAGTTAMEAHLFGWIDSGQTKFNSVYLLVRPHQN